MIKSLILTIPNQGQDIFGQFSTRNSDHSIQFMENNIHYCSSSSNWNGFMIEAFLNAGSLNQWLEIVQSHNESSNRVLKQHLT